VIRELPPSSPILETLIFRLQNSLLDSMPWWSSDLNSSSHLQRKIWLLWILFIGAVASNGRIERFWFIKELGGLCSELGVSEIEGSEGLRGRLSSVVLQDLFFEWHLSAVWEDVCLSWEVGDQGLVGGHEDD
jgi:hypothetical protein